MTEARQGGLFEAGGGGIRLAGPPLNPVSRLKTALRQACRESRWSRAQIVDRMNEQAAAEGLKPRRRITLAVLEAWLAASKTNLPDVELLPLFCWAAESLLPLKTLAACNGGEVVGEEEARLLAWARTEVEIKRLHRRRRRLEPEI